MFAFTTLLALVATASAIPTKITPRAQSSSYNSTSTNNTASGRAYKLIADYSGNSFFDHFTAFSGPDPTHGHVQYQTLKDAADQKLIGFIHDANTGNNTAYIGVDSKNEAPKGRHSVRLTSKQTFNAGSMAVIDVRHAPSQYGVWPAIWLLGSQGSWPESGESDILEYVHEEDHNGMTLHTLPGCSVSNTSLTHEQQGRLLNADCSKGDAATGCSVVALDDNRKNNNVTEGGATNTFATAGKNFNAQRGGVYVHDWQEDGITVWLFPHSHLPADLIAGNPSPSTWTQQKPLAKFSGPGCDFDKAFKSMQLIINIDFCGDWAGKVWQESGAVEATGVRTCEEYVDKNPAVFEESYFEIGGVQFYSSNEEIPGEGPTFSKRGKEDVVIVQNVTRPHGEEDDGMVMTVPAFDATHKCSNATGSHAHHGGKGNSTFNGTAVLRPRVWAPPPVKSAASSTEVAGWLFAAGMFLAFAFLA